MECRESAAKGDFVWKFWYDKCLFGVKIGLAINQGDGAPGCRGDEGLLLSTPTASGGGIALLLIVADETDNTFADIHSTAIWTATLVRVRSTRLAWAFGAVRAAVALWRQSPGTRSSCR